MVCFSRATYAVHAAALELACSTTHSAGHCSTMQVMPEPCSGSLVVRLDPLYGYHAVVYAQLSLVPSLKAS